MEKFRNAEMAQEGIIENLQNLMNEKNSDVVVISQKGKMEITNNFVLCFYNSLKVLINQFNLSKTDIMAILQILEYMQYGNLVRMSYAKLARDIGIDERNISRVIRKLKAAKLLIVKDENLYLNPHIIAKGNFKRKEEIHNDVLNICADEIFKLQDEGIDIEPSIMTNEIKSKIKSRKVTDKIKQNDLLE